MSLLIGMISFIAVLIATLPSELFYRRNIFLRMQKVDKVSLHETIQYENKILNRLIPLSRKVRKIFPFKVNIKSISKIEKNIIYAGLQNKITTDDFIGIKYVCICISVSYFGLFTIINPSGLTLFIVILSGIMAYFAPDNWLIMKAKNRQWNIKKEVPSTLTALAIVTDAGLNLRQGIEEIVKQNNGEFVEELSKTLQDIQIGITQREAFIKLSERCDSEEINHFVSALIQGLEKGSSGITNILREQAKESWEKRKHKAKELAEKASLKLFMPLLLLVFPAFVIFLMGPMIFMIIELLRG